MVFVENFLVKEKFATKLFWCASTQTDFDIQVKHCISSLLYMLQCIVIHTPNQELNVFKMVSFLQVKGKLPKKVEL